MRSMTLFLRNGYYIKLKMNIFLKTGTIRCGVLAGGGTKQTTTAGDVTVRHMWNGRAAAASVAHDDLITSDNGAGRRSALRTRMSLLRSGISRILGFPSKAAYFAFWKKLFWFDLVTNVARVGGGLLLYLFAPQIYQMLPAGLLG